jgi:hypothetical protein
MTPDHSHLGVMGHPYFVHFVSVDYPLFLVNGQPSGELVLGLLLKAALKAEQSGPKMFLPAAVVAKKGHYLPCRLRVLRHEVSHRILSNFRAHG